MEEAVHSRINVPELVPELAEISAALFEATGNGSVPRTTIGLIGLRACQITGNTYTLVRQARALRELGESEDRIDALASWWDAPYFTDAERAALALVEAVLRPSPAGKKRSLTSCTHRRPGITSRRRSQRWRSQSARPCSSCRSR
jgi:alkylhydroperoxidase family enzyme